MTLEIYNAANGIPFGTATIGGEGGKNYDKEIQELQDKIKEIELFKFPNATIIGEPSIDHGQIADFSTENYLMFPFELDVRDKAFEVQFAFTTGEDVTTQQNILDSRFGIALAIKDGLGLMAVSYNGQSWGSLASGVMQIQPNTTYYAKLTWNKLQYKTLLSTNGVDYVEDMSSTSATGPFPATIFIGGGSAEALGHTPTPFKGTINLNKAYVYINGQLIWQGMDDAGLVTRLDVDLTNITQPGIEAIQNIVGNPYTKTEIDEQMEDKQDKLIAGPNITINPDTNVISATGGGEPIDAYTKTETDGLLEKKQDVLTPNDPLKIETYVKSNLTNMVYTTDGTGIYRGSESALKTYVGNYGGLRSDTGTNAMMTGDAWSSVPTDPTIYTAEDIMYAAGYIQMPYTIGQIVAGGYSSTGNTDYYPRVLFGKAEDSTFIPILAYANTQVRLSLSDNTHVQKISGRITITTDNVVTINSNYVTTSTSTSDFFQLVDNNGAIEVRIRPTARFMSLGTASRFPAISDASYIARIKEINAVRIFSCYNGYDPAHAIAVQNIGLYTTNEVVSASTTEISDSWGPNQFDLSGVTAYNYLDLKTDSSLTVTPEGNLSVNTDAMAFGSELDYDGTNLSLLSSDGSTLSSVEISLEDKQDRLTPLAPLQIQDKLISPIENYTVTDTTIIPNKYNTEGDVPLIVQNGKVGLDLSNAHITVPFVPNGLWSGAGRPFYGFFDGDRFVPVATVKYITPTNTFSSTSYASIIFIDAENATSLSEVGYAYMGGRVVSDGTGWSSFVLNNTTGFSFTQGTYGTRATTVGSTLASNFPSNATAHQIDVNTSNKLVLQEWYNNTNGYYLYNVYVGLDAGARALWDKVTHVVTMAFAASAINKADVRYYTENSAKCALTLAGLNEYSLARPNSIDLENAQTQHQMSVNVDNTTIKVNSDGNLEAQYPAELNGVKLFPITQAGYDELAEKDPNTLYVVTDGAETMLADASNITAAGEAALCSLSFSSERFTDFTLGASGTSYTAPADGFFALVKTGATSMQYIELTAGGLTVRGFVPWNGGTAAAYIQVNKGSSLTVYYNASGATNSFRFYYAKGAQ